MSRIVDRYAVLGHPVAHSLSPKIHACFAEATGESMTYEAIQAPLAGFAETLRQFIAEGGRGVNVTVPFKEEACRLCTQRSERAQHAEAVNTLVFQAGQLYGDNTDGVGLVRDIERLGVPIQEKNLLLLGAGGAARGVLAPLLSGGPRSLTITNRSDAKAQTLAERFSAYGPVCARSYAALSGQTFDLVINATSASLTGALPPLPPGIFATDALAYDMMYSRGATPFMNFALAQGASRVADGLGMLVEQAAEAFYVWRQIRPATAPVLALLRQAGYGLYGQDNTKSA